MKNDEFNKVKITNERENFKGEFSSTQRSEFTSFNKETSSHKSELNEEYLKNTGSSRSNDRKVTNKELISKTVNSSAAASATSGVVAHTVVGASIVGITLAGTGIGISLFPSEEKTYYKLEYFIEETYGSVQTELPFSYFKEFDEESGVPLIQESQFVCRLNNGDYDEDYYCWYEPDVESKIVYLGASLDELVKGLTYTCAIYEVIENYDQPDIPPTYNRITEIVRFTIPKDPEPTLYDLFIEFEGNSAMATFELPYSYFGELDPTSEAPDIQETQFYCLISDGTTQSEEYCWFEPDPDNQIVYFGADFSDLEYETTYYVTGYENDYSSDELQGTQITKEVNFTTGEKVIPYPTIDTFNFSNTHLGANTTDVAFTYTDSENMIQNLTLTVTSDSDNTKTETVDLSLSTDTQTIYFSSQTGIKLDHVDSYSISVDATISYEGETSSYNLYVDSGYHFTDDTVSFTSYELDTVYDQVTSHQFSITLNYADEYNYIDHFNLTLTDPSDNSYTHTYRVEAVAGKQTIDDYVDPTSVTEASYFINENHLSFDVTVVPVVYDSNWEELEYSELSKSGSITFTLVEVLSFSSISFGAVNLNDQTLNLTLTYTDPQSVVNYYELMIYSTTSGDSTDTLVLDPATFVSGVEATVSFNNFESLDLMNDTFAYSLMRVYKDGTTASDEVASGDNLTFTISDERYYGGFTITNALFSEHSLTIKFNIIDTLNYYESLECLIFPTDGGSSSGTFVFDVTNESQTAVMETDATGGYPLDFAENTQYTVEVIGYITSDGSTEILDTDQNVYLTNNDISNVNTPLVMSSSSYLMPMQIDYCDAAGAIFEANTLYFSVDYGDATVGPYRQEITATTNWQYVDFTNMMYDEVYTEHYNAGDSATFTIDCLIGNDYITYYTFVESTFASEEYATIYGGYFVNQSLASDNTNATVKAFYIDNSSFAGMSSGFNTVYLQLTASNGDVYIYDLDVARYFTQNVSEIEIPINLTLPVTYPETFTINDYSALQSAFTGTTFIAEFVYSQYVSEAGETNDANAVISTSVLFEIA